MKKIIEKVQVNIPFRMLMEGYLEMFLDMGLNPEIGLDAVSMDTFSYDDCRKVANRFREKDLRITIHGPFMDLSPASFDPAIVDITQKRFDQLFCLLPAFSPVSLVAHAAYDPRRHFVMIDEWLDQSLAFFETVAQRAFDNGCRLMLENVFEEHPEELLPLIQNLNPEQAGICLDLGHMNASSPDGMEHWLATLSPYIGQLHLHDNHGDKDFHLPLGQGNIDFHTVFDFISHKQPILTLEPHEEEALYVSLDYLKRFFFS